MAFAFVSRTLANSGTEQNGPSLTVAKTVTGITAGSLIVMLVKGESIAANITASDGTSAFTGGTQIEHANGDLRARMLYLPASVASGSVTYTATFASNNTFQSIIIMEFTHDGTGAFDAAPTGGGAQSASSAAVSSGSMSSSADTNHLMIGAYGEYSSASLSSALCAGAAADGLFQFSTTNFTGMWRKTFTSGAVAGAASATLSGAQPWISLGMVFKEVGGGGGGGKILSEGGILTSGILTGGALIGGNARSTVFFPDFARARKLAFL